MKSKQQLKLLREVQSNNNLSYAEKGLFAEVLIAELIFPADIWYLYERSNSTGNTDDLIRNLVKLGYLTVFHTEGSADEYYKVNNNRSQWPVLLEST